MLATPDGLESKFAVLEGGVEDELALLKRGMLTATGTATAATAGQRPYGEVLVGSKRPVDAIDYELEELRQRARQ